jgi:hypothetical protein
MEMLKIRNTLFGLLIGGLLAGMAQDALAQRTIARSERRSDAKRPARTTMKKDKIVKQSPKQTVRKSHTSKSVRAKAMNSGNENRKKQERDAKKDRKSDERDRNHAYKYQDRKPHIPTKKTWHREHDRKPAWVDYHRPGYRYPKIGMHVSVLPYGHISFVIGKLRFYIYQGVYYRYDPALRVYIVVNKPRIETWYTSATWDRITLMDGSTIEGVYRYRDNDVIFFEVGDALLEIPMSGIKILSLSEK